MDFRSVLLVGVILGGGMFALGSSSCANVDPSEVTFEERPKTDIIGLDATPGSSSSGGTEGGTGEAGTGDGGAVDSGPVTAFSTAAAYDPTKAAAQSGAVNPSHNFVGTTNPQDPTGQDCFSCHRTGGAAPPWGLGGTAFNAMTGGTALTTRGEVRIVDGTTGKQILQAYIDDHGNFWNDPTSPIPAGAKVGIRNATVTKFMSSTLSGDTDGSCNKSTCHGTGGAAGGPVFLK